MSEQLLIKAFIAKNDIEKNRFISIINDKVKHATTSGKIIGVSCSYNVKANERIDVGMIGIFDVEAAYAINPGVSVAATTDGRAITHSSATSDIAGVAITQASAQGDLLRVLVLPQ